MMGTSGMLDVSPCPCATATLHWFSVELAKITL